jgi:hypothetical protein
MKRSKSIPDMSIYEASNFWDEHDFFEFDDAAEVKDVKFSLSRKKYIGIDMDVYKQVKREAQRLHKTEDALIDEWLKEKTSHVKV